MKDLKRVYGCLHVGTGGALLFNCHLSFVICKCLFLISVDSFLLIS